MKTRIEFKNEYLDQILVIKIIRRNINQGKDYQHYLVKHAFERLKCHVEPRNRNIKLGKSNIKKQVQ